MSISPLVMWFMERLPVYLQQKLDGLNVGFLQRIRVFGGPLVTESCFHIHSIPAIQTFETKKWVGYCSCGALLTEGDKIIFSEVESEIESSTETIQPLECHTLIRKVDGVLCRLYCLDCQLRNRIPKNIKGFANLGEGGILIMDKVNFLLRKVK